MNIRVFFDQKRGKIRNFWNNIHFHPTDAIEDAWGQRILNRVSEDRVARTVRMYAMLEDIVSMDEDGRLHYDFTLNDTRIDYMLDKGFDLLLSYNFIPPCISSNPDEVSRMCKSATRYKGKFIVTAPPGDYALWEEICRQYTRHLVERYGAERVRSWHLQCFNEPDIESFFMKGEKDAKVRAGEYSKLYDAFARGVLSVDDGLCVGGPALAGNLTFYEQFLRHLRDTDTRIDYICVHAYGTDPAFIQYRPLNVRNSIAKLRRLQALAKQYGFGHLPFIVDEWGASACGFYNIEEEPLYIFRDTEKFAAYFARMITLYEDMDMGLDKLILCLSGQHEMKQDFTGFRNFFSLNFFARPIYHAYKLAAKLGNVKLGCDTEAVRECMTVFPTADGERIAVLLCHSADDLRDLEEESVELTVSGFSGQKRARLWRIDQTHANAYHRFQKLGCPDPLTEEQILDIRAFGECEPTEIGPVAAGQSITLDMPSDCVLLVEYI